MLGIFLAILLACLAYVLVSALTGSFIFALIAAVLVLLAFFGGHGTFGGTRRW